MGWFASCRGCTRAGHGLSLCLFEPVPDDPRNDGLLSGRQSAPTHPMISNSARNSRHPFASSGLIDNDTPPVLVARRSLVAAGLRAEHAHQGQNGVEIVAQTAHAGYPGWRLLVALPGTERRER